MFSRGADLAPELSQHFQIPENMLSKAYRRSNGFFSLKESRDKHGYLQSYYTWFRVLIKAVSHDSSSSYRWHELTFCSRWDTERCSVLCIGADRSFQSLLQGALSQMWSHLPPSQPYSLHVPIIEVIIAMQDLSVWSVRDIVRGVEQNRSCPTGGSHAFLGLHEASRHAIHSFETLSVAVEILRALQQHASGLPSAAGQSSEKFTEASYCIQVQIDSQVRMFQNLLLRSQSNKDRLQNEIALAHNLMTQRDSHVMAGLGRAARLDSRAMRNIAVVTLAFLPPTFLSTIFGMSFFNYAPEKGSQGGGWSISDKFWIYWAFAIPLTCLTLATWFWGHKPKKTEVVSVS